LGVVLVPFDTVLVFNKGLIDVLNELISTDKRV